MTTPTVLFISPGYPGEMPAFVRGLASVGARVIGVGDQPTAALPAAARGALSAYLQVRSLWDHAAVVEQIRAWPAATGVTRVESLWEPAMLLAAWLREALGVPGLTVAQTVPFRDKSAMKQVLDAAGLRTPHHRRCTSVAACWEAAEALGFPLIVKPIDGAGSADTYRVDDADALRDVLPRLHHVPEVSVEEFVDGTEYTFDTIAIDGQAAYHNIAVYRPRPLIARSNEWISPQVVALRDVDAPELADGTALGHQVLAALGFETGFTHMEWYRTADGEVVFGEIGARPPGAYQVDQMNYACDIDVFAEWGRAVAYGAFEATVERKYNVATVYKRARGHGRITRHENEHLLRKHADHIVWNDLLPVGAPRRNWLQTLVSDGFVMLRHPELDATLEIADELGTHLQLFAG